MEVSDIGRSHQRHLPRQKVSNSENKAKGSVPEMPAESCREIKASQQGMAVSGRYWLEPRVRKMKSKNFLVIN